jgi:hypothetical protein
MQVKYLGCGAWSGAPHLNALTTAHSAANLRGQREALPLSCQPDALSGVLFGELGFGLTNHQDGEGDGRQHTEAEQHPVEDAGSIS